MRQRRIRLALGIATALLLVMAVGRVSAAESRQGDECIVGPEETITSDFYVACNTLTIEGVVEGDLIGGAWSTEIADGGRIEGDIWLIGGQLTVRGSVEDDIHFAGVDLDLAPEAALGDNADIAAAALNVEIWEGAALPGDLLVLGYQALVRGDVGQDVSFNGSALVINGSIDGDIFASVGGGDTSPSFIPFPFPFSVSFQTPGLTVQSDGRIGGDLNYTGPGPGSVNGRISGTINFELVQPRPDITQASLEEQTTPLDVFLRYLREVLKDVLSLMAAGVLVVLIVPSWVQEPAAIAPRHLPSSLGWGLVLALLAAPIGLILVIVSVLLLVLVSTVTLGGFTWMALGLLIILNAVVIGGFAFFILFVARLVISELIGRRFSRRIMRRFVPGADRLTLNLVALLTGAVLYALVVNVPLPWIGLVVNAIGIFVGLGALALHFRQVTQRAQRAYPPPEDGLDMLPPPSTLEALLGSTPAPPPDSAEPPPPGSANLPEGFDWWRSERGRPRGEE